MQETITAFVNWGSGSEWFWSMLQFGVVTVTLILIYLQLRFQTAQLQLQTGQLELQSATHVVSTLHVIHARWTSEAMLRARHEYCSSWLQGNRGFNPVGDYIGEFMEELGSYLRLQAIPPRILWDAQSWYVESYYVLLKQHMEEYRTKYKDPTLYCEFEKLFHTMMEVSKTQGAPPFVKTEPELQTFAESEIRMAETFLELKAQGVSVAKG